MDFRPGDIYQGAITAFGHEGPLTHWIVVDPFGRTHFHSIDDPYHLHCMPLAIAEAALLDGRLEWLMYDPEHPVIELQRVKESMEIPDSHLGLKGPFLTRMLVLLENAVASGAPYAPYAAGEIISLSCIHQNEAQRHQVQDEVIALLAERPEFAQMSVH